LPPGDGSELLAVAWGVGAVALGLTVALALQVLVFRARNNRRDRRRRRVFETWRPLLFAHLLGNGPPLPALERGQDEDFLLLWNQLQDGIRGESHARLVAVAEAIGGREAARRLLQRGDTLGLLLAVRTLGYLGHPADYDDLLRFADDRRPYLCLAVGYALARVDRHRAPADLLPRLAARPDWPVALFAMALAEADPGELSAAMGALQVRLGAAELVRLLPLTAFLPPEAANRILRELLERSADSGARSDDPEVLCGVLRAVRDPALLPVVREASAHAAWSVRTQAAAALGRVGAAEDRPALVALLRDPSWWVRYRAAQALTSGRFGPVEEIVAAAEALQDRFARDIVQHALAEARP
jgi:HEAT repeat protein